MIDSGAERVVTTSMLVTARTHVGMRREENQDRALVVIGGTRESLDPVDHDGVLELRRVPTEGSVLLVADGMGGRSGGSTAAKIASDAVRRTFERRDVGGASPNLFVKTLNEALLKANRDVLWEAQGEASLTDMGTTATLVGVLGDRVHVAQVGDSRAYLIRGGAIVRLTRDQSLVQDLIDSGILDESDTGTVNDNLLLQAVGTQPELRPAHTFHALRERDRLLLCSDGLSQMVRDDELASICTEEPDASLLVERLVALANERGGPDNTTVLVADLIESGLPDPGSEDTLSAKRWRGSRS